MFLGIFFYFQRHRRELIMISFYFISFVFTKKYHATTMMSEVIASSVTVYTGRRRDRPSKRIVALMLLLLLFNHLEGFFHDSTRFCFVMFCFCLFVCFVSEFWNWPGWSQNSLSSFLWRRITLMIVRAELRRLLMSCPGNLKRDIEIPEKDGKVIASSSILQK